MKKNILTVVSFSLLLFAACHKDKSSSNTGNYTSPDDFFQKNQVASQPFSFTNSAGAILRTSGGTTIHFAQNAFVDGNNVVVNGTINIQVKEILRPGDMILSNMPPMWYGQPLESGGEFFIGATANGNTVHPAAGKRIQLELPSLGVPMAGMQVYNGYTWGYVGSADSSMGTGVQINWKPNNSPTNGVVPDTLNAYNLFCDSINWVNCDRLARGTFVNYKVLPGNCPSFDSTRVFVQFTGRNVVEALSPIGGPYFTGELIAAPVTIVGICIKDGKLWSSVTTATLQNGQSSAMNFSPTNETDLKATLSALK